jgi:hypothetical protein
MTRGLNRIEPYLDSQRLLRSGRGQSRGDFAPALAQAGVMRKKVPMMTDVACFCGCCYSFAGGAGACPRCGEVASVTAGLAYETTGGSEQEQPAFAGAPVLPRADHR